MRESMIHAAAGPSRPRLTRFRAQLLRIRSHSQRASRGLHLKPRIKDNLIALLACLALALLFAAVAWWAWSGVLAAHESANEQLQRADYRGTRTATSIYSYSLYFVAIGVLASTLSLAALGVAAYIFRAMRRGTRIERRGRAARSES